MSAEIHNEAAWLDAEKANPLVVGPAPSPCPGEGEVVVKVAYAAVNPADYMLQDAPFLEMPYPWVMGIDIAGTIVQLGPGTGRFKIGERVMGHCHSLLSRKSAHSGFQRYATCLETLVALVPDDISLSQAAVLPLALSTTSTALFYKLRLPFPALLPRSIDQKILIWGGSSSCGSCAIQLAVAAGLTVVTTAGKANHEYVRALGAAQVFDHADPNVQENITKVLRKGDVALDCIATAATQAICGEIVKSIGGGKLALLLWPSVQFPEDVEVLFAIATSVVDDAPDVTDAVWRQYIPQALEAGKLRAKPDPFIISGGLAKVQQGIDVVRKGVSATKVVIEIAGE